MTPYELYREGELRGAIKTLGEELRSNPLDSSRRTFLFELLLFAGEFDRAGKQLDILAEASSEAAAGALLYQSALHAERTRRGMFIERTFPQSGQGSSNGGSSNGVEFADLVDSDPRIGANLEVFLAGSYTWIPIRYLRKLEIESPRNLRDLVWARARVETSAEFRLQDIGEVLLPALCPLSCTHSDQTVQLGREAVWEPDEEFGAIPFGAKTLLIDGVEMPLLQLRRLSWLTPEKESRDASVRESA